MPDTATPTLNVSLERPVMVPASSSNVSATVTLPARPMSPAVEDSSSTENLWVSSTCHGHEMCPRSSEDLETTSDSASQQDSPTPEIDNAASSTSIFGRLIFTPRPAGYAPRIRQPEPDQVYPRVFWAPGEGPDIEVPLSTSMGSSRSLSTSSSTSRASSSETLSVSIHPSPAASPPESPLLTAQALGVTANATEPAPGGSREERHSSIAPAHIRAARDADNLTSSTLCSFTWNSGSGSGSGDHTGSTRATSVSDPGEDTDPEEAWEPQWPWWLTQPHNEWSEDDLEDAEWAGAEIIAGGEDLYLLAEMESLTVGRDEDDVVDD